MRIKRRPRCRGELNVTNIGMAGIYALSAIVVAYKVCQTVAEAIKVHEENSPVVIVHGKEDGLG